MLNINIIEIHIGLDHPDEFFIIIVPVTEEDAESIKYLFRKIEATIHAGIAFTGIKVFDVGGVAVRALG